MRPPYLLLHPDAAGVPTDFRHPLEILQNGHDHIAHHCFTLQTLARYLRTCGGDARAREKAANVLRWFETDGRFHHEDEEVDLFPRLAAATGGTKSEGARRLIARLQADHRQMEAMWSVLQIELRRIANDESTELSEAMVEKFDALHRKHMHTEEEQLMPLARSLLVPAELAAIGQAMQARRRAAARQPGGGM